MIAAWMLSAIVFAALLGGAALLAESALRNASRQTRWPWLVALAAGGLWPVLAPVVRRAVQDSPTMLDVAVAMPSVRVVPDSLPGVPLTQWIDAALLSIWAAASLIALARLVYAIVLVRRIRRSSEPRVVDEVPVLLTGDVGPAVVGLIQPKVLIPASFLELDRPLRRLALRHELEHGRAHDQLALVGSAVALALVPWNLPLWWIVRRYRLAIEIDCDARVLATEPNARQYGQLLLLISQRVRVTTFAPMLAGSSSHLERRIAAMIPVLSQGRRTRIAVALAGAVVVAIAACTSRISDVDSGTTPRTAVRVARADSVKPYVEFAITKPARQVEGTGQLRYPAELGAEGVAGEVRAQFVVREDGFVDQGTFRVLRSDHDLFTKSVRSALPYMKFAPAETNGTPVRQLVTQTFSFGLDADDVLPLGLAYFRGAAVSPFTSTASEHFVVAANTLAQQIPGTGNIRYPDELRKAKVEGEVIAQFVVDQDGRIEDGTFKVMKSSNPLFDVAVRNATPNMRFTPAIVGGKTVKQLIQRPFTFSLSK